MAESLAQSERDPNNKPDEQPPPPAPGQELDTALLPGSHTPIIWTPRFIMLFGLLLVTGLSAASLLTQAWLNGRLSGEGILLGYVTLILASWIATIVCARSVWIRLGALFSCIWTIFTAIGFAMTLLAVHANVPIVSHVNAATSSALLGGYICLSVDRTPFHRWDAWLFRLIPFVGLGAIGLAYLLIPAEVRTFTRLEDSLAATALSLSIAVWWLRPSCWRTQAGPTLLFGLAPCIQLLLTFPTIPRDVNLFFSQVVLLCFFLGAIRVLQGEIRWRSVDVN